MMAYSEDHIALAAEYALGTLDADERKQVEAMMAVDTDFTVMVQAWQFRLGVLNQMVGSVEPRPEVWEKIRTEVGRSEARAPLVLPEPPLPSADAPDLDTGPAMVTESAMVTEPAVVMEPAAVMEPAVVMEPAEAVEPAAVPAAANVIDLASRTRRWRGVAVAMSAIAAALAAIIAVGIYQPDLLPDQLRPKPRIRVVEVKSPPAPTPPSEQYVAVLQRDGGSPAFILTVDGATKEFTVRKVAAAGEPGKSYELWLISDRLPRPRSLGVIGNGDFTARAVLASYDTEIINNATFAVTIEQAGGSPDGLPHSSPVFVGKLIEAVPPAASATPPNR
jgi:anti-sigma-K factor RskA